MKFVIILSILSCLLLECHTSPVQIVENHNLAKQSKDVTQVVVGRQSASSAAQPDDDDDDDDDDDIEALVDEDDDG